MANCLHAWDERPKRSDSIAKRGGCALEWPDAMNDLAWLLATSPDPAVRDPQAALNLSRSALKLNQNRQPISMDTMATALAASGDFDGATQMQQSAIDLALKNGADSKLLAADETPTGVVSEASGN